MAKCGLLLLVALAALAAGAAPSLALAPVASPSVRPRLALRGLRGGFSNDKLGETLRGFQGDTSKEWAEIVKGTGDLLSTTDDVFKTLTLDERKAMKKKGPTSFMAWTAGLHPCQNTGGTETANLPDPDVPRWTKIRGAFVDAGYTRPPSTLRPLPPDLPTLFQCTSRNPNSPQKPSFLSHALFNPNASFTSALLPSTQNPKPSPPTPKPGLLSVPAPPPPHAPSRHLTRTAASRFLLRSEEAQTLSLRQPPPGPASPPPALHGRGPCMAGGLGGSHVLSARPALRA